MARDDGIDRTALIFVTLTAIFLLVLAYSIFPRPEATSAGGSAPSSAAPSAAKK
jgi:hypothetical protein